jgi:uncharacterized cupredoxin-like copper-binding protein
LHRKSLLVVLGMGCAVLMAWLFGAAAGPASGQVKAHATPKATVINVWAGKPTELGFTLSKASGIPAGPVTFKVTNVGVAFHDFEICSAPTVGGAKNSCVGKVTKVLHNGQSATLTVTLKKGKYEFLCNVAGHAASGMKGLIGVGVTVPNSAAVVGTVKVAASSTSKTSVSSSGSSSGSSGGGVTTTPAGGGGGGGGGATASECPAGVTIATAGNDDHDEDEGGGPSDLDGCI